MNFIIRGVALIAVLFSAATWLPAQNPAVQDDLLRADKQFDLYAYNIARSSYEKVLQADPYNARALARIADCYVQTNRPEDALPFYERATSAPGMDPDVMLRYGKALMMTGDYVTAKTWFQFYGEGNPTVGQHFSQMCDYAISASNKEALYVPRLENLNTDAADYAPAFYGTKIVYNSARTDLKRKTNPKSTADWTGGSATNQPFITQRSTTDGALQKPEFLRSDLQNTWNEGPVSFSADGKKVVFSRNNYINGARQIAEKGLTMSLYTADVDNGEWKNIRAFPYNGSDYGTGFPCLSSDGNTLWFASNRPDGLGGWDIYVSEWTGTTWSAPSNMGAPLNTAGNEITPFIAGDNLYFSSDYHRGLGGMDVFRAELQGWQVNNIFHLGPGVNSPRDDYGFIFDASENIGYFTSNRPEGVGNEDIWQIKKKLDEFVITVVDEYRTPIANAEIDFTACGAGVMRTNALGQYSFAVSSGQADCNAAVKKYGYQSTDIQIRSAGKKNLTVTLNTLPAYAEPEPTAASAQLSSRAGIPAQSPATYSTPLATPAADAMVNHSLNLYDAVGRPLTNATVDLSTCGLGNMTTDATGSLYFQLPAGTTCCLVVQKPGYEEAVIPITSSSSGEKSVSLSPLNSPVVPIQAGKAGTYTGTILDAETMNDVEGVTVRAQKLPNGQIMSTTSNNLGRYIFNLEAGGYYQFTYLKKGYQQEVMNYLISVNNTARTITHVILQPGTGTSTAAATAPAQYTTPTSVSPTRLMAPQTTAVPAAPATPTFDGYAVQLAAQPTPFTDADMKKYQSLSSMGNLYTVQDEKMSRLRLGVFANKADADAANKQAQLTAKGSFVVPEKKAEEALKVSSQTLAATPAEYNTIAAKGGGKGAPVVGTQPLSAAPVATPAPVVNPIRYAVQIASLSTNKSVDLNEFSSLSSLGNVYMKPENEMLKIRVGIWEQHADAEEAQQQIVQRGFKDAIIVTEKASDPSLQNFFISSVNVSGDAPAQYSAPASTTPKSAKMAGATPAIQIAPGQSAKSAPTAVPANYTLAPPASALSAEGTQYLIRVCLMNDLDNFDPKSIQGVGGKQERWPIAESGATAIMLTGYTELESALTALYRLRERSFPDAYLLRQENGEMKKLRY
ncbi:MAG: carboxypeptidase regulatory-like domain-containing protein [Saprospiraceae bacterium]|nr:carboxypeptidase regulatory-like domain-containing protein [Saprospiraceae bacterium]